MQSEPKLSKLSLSSQKGTAFSPSSNGTLLVAVALLSTLVCAVSVTKTSAMESPAVPSAFSAADLAVDPNLSFEGKVKRHAEILGRFEKLIWRAEEREKQAKVSNRLNDYLDAQKSIADIEVALTPYAIAQSQANKLVKDGYQLKDFSGNVYGKQGDSKVVDSATAVFFFTGNEEGLATASGKSSKQSDDPKGDVFINGFNVSEFARFLSGDPLNAGTFGVLPLIRDAVIPKSDNGDIANAIRDPGKVPVKILNGLGDTIKADNGDVGNAVKQGFSNLGIHAFGS